MAECNYNILLLAESGGIGKTSLLKRYTENEFKEESNTTIGLEMGNKITKLKNGKTVQLKYWKQLVKNVLEVLHPPI